MAAGAWSGRTTRTSATRGPPTWRDGGEFNIGQLCRERFGDAVYTIGFGTDSGTVATASNWDEPMEVKTLRPALPESYERLFHRTGMPGMLLPLRRDGDSPLVKALSEPRLERAVGVIYHPETERVSHYFHADLPAQFDEYVWIDQSRAVTPLDSREIEGAADTYPFGV